MKNYSLRLMSDSDKEMILLWRNHPEVRQVMLNDHVITAVEHDRWWQSLKHKKDIYLIVLKHDTPVGVINFYSINEQDNTAWWGFYIDNEHINLPQERVSLWLAIEELVIDYADNTLNLVNLYCESLALNKMVVELHKRYGFEICEKPFDARETTKSVVYMKKSFASRNKKMTTYFLSSYSTNVLVSDFSNLLKQYSSLNIDVDILPFAQYTILLQDTTHELHAEGNQLVFCERIEDFIPAHEMISFADIQKLSSDIDDYFSLITSFCQQNSNNVYVFDFKSIQTSVQILSEAYHVTDIEKLISEKNEALKKLSEDHHFTLVPYSIIATSYGIHNSYSNKYWNLARIPFSKGFSTFLTNRLLAIMMSTRFLQARVLVLDLDNTLWKGVIGDDGINGIQLGGDFPGNIYKSLQRLFKAYKDSGLLLCICSKNTESVALEAINNHPEMILKQEDFIVKKINWSSKVDNIRAIAKTLNLGLSSLCFIDDNPMERQEVRDQLPDVFVPELPDDPSDWYSFIVNLPELTLYSVNDQDRQKTEQYQKRALIQQASSRYEDKSAFIRSLEIQVRIRSMQDQDFARVYQLFNKTNQFNTTTIRYTQLDLSQIKQSDQDRVYYVEVKDKYNADYEGLATLVVKTEGNVWFIENFVMSCRVMGRSLEDAIIAWLSYQASMKGITLLKAQYIATDRNQPVADLYQRLKFNQADDGFWYRAVMNQEKESLDMDVEGYSNV